MEDTSRCCFVRTGLVMALLAVFAMSAAGSAQASESKHCSNMTAVGTWGFTTNGTIPAIGPVAAAGTLTQDVSGNITGSQTRSLNGGIADETFTGTGTVNADCSATDTIQVYESGVLVRTSTLHLVYDDNGREARGIFTSIVLPDGTNLPNILTVDARKVFPKD